MGRCSGRDCNRKIRPFDRHTVVYHPLYLVWRDNDVCLFYVYLRDGLDYHVDIFGTIGKLGDVTVVPF